MELVLAQDITTDSIYTERAPFITGNEIYLEDKIQEYQINVSSTIAISINTAKLTKFTEYNCEFTLYVNSSGNYALNLQNCAVQQIEVWRGVTKLHFSHIIGEANWRVEIVQVGNQIPEYVRPGNNYDIPKYNNYGIATTKLNNGYAAGVEVFLWMDTPETKNSNNKEWGWATSELSLYTIFPAPFIMTEWRLHVCTTLTYNFAKSVTVYGSNDYSNWAEVSSVAGLTYTVSQEIKVFTPTIQRPYRAYKFVFVTNSGNIQIIPVSISGYKCQNIGNLNFYRYPKIAAATSGYELSYNSGDGITEINPLYYCVNTDQSGGRAQLARSSSNIPFIITYTLPQAVRFEGFLVKTYNEYSQWWCNGWFKWEGSNDGTNWTRLCELRKPFKDYYINNMYLFYMCHTQGTYSRFRIVIYTVQNEYENQVITGGLFPIYTIPYEYRQFDTIVPAMASDTQDGYTVSSSSVTSGYTYYMYDTNSSTYCQGDIADGQWITLIDMGSSVVVKGFQLQAVSDNYTKMPITFSVQGSPDNSTWQILQSYTLGLSGWSANGQVQSFTVNNTTGYRYYRLVVTAVQDSGSNVRIAGIGWSGAAGQPPIDYYTVDYLVPVMSNDSQDGYVASAISYYNSEHAPWHAFNRTTNSNTDVWATADSNKSDDYGNCTAWLEVQMPTAKSVNHINIVAQPGDTLKLRAPKNFKLQGSNNGSDWTDLFTTEETESYTDKSWDFTQTAAYSYYRLYITKTFASNDNIAISQLNLNIYHTYND